MKRYSYLGLFALIMTLGAACTVEEDLDVLRERAREKLNRFKVTFNINGGSGKAPSAQIEKRGTNITLPDGDGFSKTGYVFGGWNTKADGTGENYNAGDPFTSPVDHVVTLYARWSGNTETETETYTVTFDLNGGDSYTPTASITLYAKWILGMVFVRGGSFEMGRNLGTDNYGDVAPVHTVTLTSFYMGKYQVTQSQYATVMRSNPGSSYENNHPLYNVSWYDALVFCNRLSIAEGFTPAYQINDSTDPAAWGTVPTSSNSTWNAAEIVSGSTGYRLPTEAQWEYAAKGGNGSPGNYTYAGSNTVGDVAWYSSNSGSATHAVGTKAPNGLGLYDMSGNVEEWCWDWYGSYSSSAQTDPLGASSGPSRVLRGGSWFDAAESVRSAYRYSNGPNSRSSGFGFRLARP